MQSYKDGSGRHVSLGSIGIAVKFAGANKTPTQWLLEKASNKPPANEDKGRKKKTPPKAPPPISRARDVRLQQAWVLRVMFLAVSLWPPQELEAAPPQLAVLALAI